MQNEAPTISTTADLDAQLSAWDCPADLSELLVALADAGAALSFHVASPPGYPTRGIGSSVQPARPDAAALERNGGDDIPQPLDLLAHDLFVEAVRPTGVHALVSEEAHEIITLAPDGDFLLAIDPLDGSSNIAINAPMGTIFSVSRVDRGAGPPADVISVASSTSAVADLEAQFLQAGRRIEAAGYIMFGPATVMVLATAGGVAALTLDAELGRFIVADPDLRLPDHGKEFAINVSNYRHWEHHVTTFINDLISGADGGGGVDYNMRWVAALVAECHRVLTRGGIFLYPADGRDGYRAGRLRLLYEAHPIAYIVEQAGGTAIDGQIPILDKVGASVHERSPLVFGSPAEVRSFEAHRDARPFTGELAPLFSNRGLYRSPR